MDEDEHKLQLGDTRMGPFGVVVKDKWIPVSSGHPGGY